MTVKFFLRNGTIINWPIPQKMQEDGFNFYALVKAVRSDGHFIAADCYIPHDVITMIALESTAAQVVIPGAKGKPN